MQRQCKRVRSQTCLSILQRVQPAFARSAKVQFLLRIIANCCQLNETKLMFSFEKYVIIRQIAIFFIDLARYMKFLSYFCVNKTH